MPTESRKRPHHATVENDKRIRHADMPFPAFIQMDSGQNPDLIYFFERTDLAEKFIDSISIHLSQPKRILNSYVSYQHRYSVSLTHDEVDLIFGDGSYQLIAQCYFSDDMKKTVFLLQNQDTPVLRQAMFLQRKEGRMLFARILFETTARQSLAIMEHLNEAACDALARSLIYAAAFTNQARITQDKIPALIAFFEKQSADAFADMILFSDAHGKNLLHHLCEYPEAIFTAAFQKLTPARRSAAIVHDTEGESLLYYMHCFQSYAVIQAYINGMVRHEGDARGWLLSAFASRYATHDSHTHRSRHRDNDTATNNLLLLLAEFSDRELDAIMKQGRNAYVCSLLSCIASYNIVAAKHVIERLSTQAFNAIALQKFSGDYVNGLHELLTATHTLSLVDNFHRLIIDKLTDETCNTVALSGGESHDRTLFVRIIEVLGDEKGRYFLDRVSKENMNTLALRPQGLVTVYAYLTEKHVAVAAKLHENLTTETMTQLVFRSVFGLEELTTWFQLSLSARTDAVTPMMFKLLGTALQHTGELQRQSQTHSQLSELTIQDGGRSRAHWPVVARELLKQVPAIWPRSAARHITAAIPGTRRDLKPVRQFFSSLEQQQWRFLRLQGRTLLMQNAKQDILAIKIQKQGEDSAALFKEYDTTLYLRNQREALQLKSELPKPLEVASVSDVLRYLADKVSLAERKALKEMIGRKGPHTVYLYQTTAKSNGYFTYLHDASLSQDTFATANQIAVHDLFTLLMHGMVFTNLADLFHNTEHRAGRSDAGRYQVLVDLLRPNLHMSGTGRITGWKKAVEYPNLRLTGLADLGDSASINKFIGSTTHTRQFYRETVSAYDIDHSGNYLMMNIMAEYQYVLFLIAGRRGAALTAMVSQESKDPANVEHIWKTMAQQVFDNCVQGAVLMTKHAERKVRETLSALISVDRLAKQMHYWMTSDYVEDLKQDHIPEVIYGKDTKVTVNFTDFRAGTFHPVLGCAINGVDQDLGPVNGQEPIKEANKLIYWMINYILYTYNELTLTLDDLHAIRLEDYRATAEIMRKQSFGHLPDKQYHALQLALCEERLKQTGMTRREQHELAKEADHHRQTHAAITLQQFWRNHGMRRVDEEKAVVMEAGESLGLGRR